MSDPTLDDLRVWQVNEANVAGGSGWWRELTPAEFDRIATERGYVRVHPKVFEEVAEALGWVKRPVCGECEGHGIDPESYVPATYLEPEQADRCPSCGGTGFGRLVALDGIDVERLRRFHEDRDNDEMVRASEVHNLINPVLAAIDGGQE